VRWGFNFNNLWIAKTLDNPVSGCQSLSRNRCILTVWSGGAKTCGDRLSAAAFFSLKPNTSWQTLWGPSGGGNLYTQEYRVFTYRAILAPILILVGPCNAQQVGFNVDDSPQLIRNVLREAHVSGSLAYSASCKSPIVPHVRTPRRSGSAADVLQSMFDDQSTIHVTQEPNGLVRMAAVDVPTDILRIRIHHISFAQSDSEPVSGPPFAVMRIMSASEVGIFMKEHDIRTSAFRIEGTYPRLPDIPGELYDVTVSEALDYVLMTFPGYWVYENCTTPESTRSINFRFY
jgi:hypothetical protein